MNPSLQQSRPTADPHAGQPVHSVGLSPELADATLILVPGRGAKATAILSLYEAFELPTLAALAPQAASSSWYPKSFLAPLEENQPYLDSALHRLESIVADLLDRDVPVHRIALFGFSQGACLVSEFVARHPRPYGAVMALTGGLVGPADTPREYPGSLDGTHVFLGTSDPDPHVPFERVQDTQAVLGRMGAEVELRRYSGMPHRVNEDELDACQELLEAVIAQEREARP